MTILLEFRPEFLRLPNLRLSLRGIRSIDSSKCLQYKFCYQLIVQFGLAEIQLCQLLSNQIADLSVSWFQRMGNTHKKKAILYSSGRNVFNKETYIACFLSFVFHQHFLLELVVNPNLNKINFSYLLSFSPCGKNKN